MSKSIQHPASFGAPYEGGFYGGQIRIGERIVAVAWAPKATGEKEGRWLARHARVAGADSCFDSHANTLAMQADGSEIATWATEQSINGHTDWVVPARDVLELAYRHLKPTVEENFAGYRDGENPSSLPVGYAYTEAFPEITSAGAFREGGSEAFDEVLYWSSTQYSDNSAWCQYFYGGSQNDRDKSAELRVRLCRLIPLSA